MSGCWSTFEAYKAPYIWKNSAQRYNLGVIFMLNILHATTHTRNPCIIFFLMACKRWRFHLNTKITSFFPLFLFSYALHNKMGRSMQTFKRKKKKKTFAWNEKREWERVVVWKRLITHQMTRNEIPLLLTYNFLQYSLSWSQIFLLSFFNANVQHNRKMKSWGKNFLIPSFQFCSLTMGKKSFLIYIVQTILIFSQQQRQLPFSQSQEFLSVYI